MLVEPLHGDAREILLRGRLLAHVAAMEGADLTDALDEAGARSSTSDSALEAYQEARIVGLRSALAILALMALLALFLAQRIPKTQPAAAPT